MAEDLNQFSQISGHVKWFDPGKGFGFVVADDGGPDILLHVNVLRAFGQNSVADSARIDLLTHATERGIQAVEVLSLEPPTREVGTLTDLNDLPKEDIGTLPLEPGRVKWFDKTKGFGFANVFGKSDDVFLHIEVLRLSGLSDVQPGEALAMRVIDGKRGRMAAHVYPWEQAVAERSES